MKLHLRGLGQQPCLSVIDKEWLPLNRWALEHGDTQTHPRTHTHPHKHNPAKLQVCRGVFCYVFFNSNQLCFFYFIPSNFYSANAEDLGASFVPNMSLQQCRRLCGWWSKMAESVEGWRHCVTLDRILQRDSLCRVMLWGVQRKEKL